MHPNDASLEEHWSSEDEDVNHARDDARLAVERFTATVSGIADGIVEGIERFRIVDETEDAMDQTRRVITETTHEAREQWQHPESQELRHDVQSAAQNLKQGSGSAAQRFRVPVQQRSQELVDRGRQTKDNLAERMEHGQERVLGAARKVQVKVRSGAETVRDSADAIQETTRRSRGGMTSVRQHTGNAVGATARWLGYVAGGYAAAGFVGAFAVLFLGLGSIAAFNLLLGTPWGYFITFGIYAIAAGAIVWGARAAGEKQLDDARDEMHQARRTVRTVVEPVRSAFGNGNARPQRLAERPIPRETSFSASSDSPPRTIQPITQER